MPNSKVDRLGRPMKHGMAGTPEYKAWIAMRSRCNNPRNQKYDRYGRRGISVCQRWMESFADFFDDMGPRPSPKHSIERIENNGNYEPSNCKWGTDEEQNRNRSDNVLLEHDGKIMTLAEWASFLGMGPKTLSCRIQAGWTVHDALTTPIRKHNWDKITFNGESLTRTALAKKLGMDISNLCRRIRTLPLSEALTRQRRKRQES